MSWALDITQFQKINMPPSIAIQMIFMRHNWVGHCMWQLPQSSSKILSCLVSMSASCIDNSIHPIGSIHLEV